MREKATTSVGRVGLCLGLGIMLGLFLSFSNYVEPNSLNFSIVFVYGLPWNVLMLIGLFFFSSWIAAGASAWLDIATTGRSLRLIYTVGLMIASVVLVVWLAQLSSFKSESEFIREGGLTAFDPVLVLLALPAQFLNALLQPETLLAFISLWAFPMAAWFWRGRVRKATGSNWAFLDSSFQRLPWSHQEPLSPRFALTLGLLVGFVFCVLLLFGGRIAFSISWQTFCFVVNGGALLALPVAIGVSAVVARARPGSPLYAAREVPQKKSNRFLWIALGIVTGLLVLLCAYSVFFYVTPPTPTPANAITSTPTTTLNTYCSALKKGDYHTAYKQLSSGVQRQRTEAEFASIHRTIFAANGGLSNCVISNVIVKDQLAGGLMTWITGNGRRAIYDCVLMDPGDGWKIVSLTSQH